MNSKENRNRKGYPQLSTVWALLIRERQKLLAPKRPYGHLLFPDVSTISCSSVVDTSQRKRNYYENTDCWTVFFSFLYLTSNLLTHEISRESLLFVQEMIHGYTTGLYVLEGERLSGIISFTFQPEHLETCVWFARVQLSREYRCSSCLILAAINKKTIKLCCQDKRTGTESFMAGLHLFFIILARLFKNTVSNLQPYNNISSSHLSTAAGETGTGNDRARSLHP